MADRIITEINYDASMQPVATQRVKRIAESTPNRPFVAPVTIGQRTICWCGSTAISGWGIKDGIELIRCTSCGTGRVSRYNLATFEQYRTGSYHLRPPRGESPFHERFAEDSRVAKLRLARLAIYQELTRPCRLLDVGAGSGAFVEAAIDAGYDAYGCDLSIAGTVAAKRTTQTRIRKGDLGSSGFGRRSLNVMTMLDVLEHTPDPYQELQKAAVLLRRDGLLVVELPNCGTPQAITEGVEFKHVKPFEHLWYWSESQFQAMAEAAGFFAVGIEHPIHNKMVFYLSPAAKREKIRVIGPPGIGDIHWVLLKVRDLVRREAPCELTMQINVKGDPHHAHRSREYMEMIPWIDHIEFAPEDLVQDIGCIDPFSGTYHWIANDHLEAGKRIEDWHPEYAADFDYEFDISDADRALAKRLGRLAGGLFVFYMSSMAWNVACSGTGRIPWGTIEWASLGRQIQKKFGAKPILIGKDWDGDYLNSLAKLLAEDGESLDSVFLNMVGKTSVGLASALMAESSATVGMCAGITILGVHVDAPSVMFWPEAGVSRTARMQFHPGFQTDWVSPKQLESGRYIHRSLGKFKVADIFNDVCRLAALKESE